MASLPEKIGKYDVLGVLGTGGMGIVYKGIDRRIGRNVAIKMMTAQFRDQEQLLTRFYREAQSAGILQHPNIVIVYELGDEGGVPYIVMEYLDGKSLEAVMREHQPLGISQKIGMMRQVCEGLAYAHAHGVVHRDIKPGNLILVNSGTMKIVDFGIAHLSAETVTKPGQVIGTVTYMAPEQLRGEMVDGRADVFAAAVVLFKLLSGRLPFEGTDTGATMRKILADAPPDITHLVTECPVELVGIFRRALAKDREDRYATAEEFALDLAGLQTALDRKRVETIVDQARIALKRYDLGQARGLLMDVLRLDAENGPAKQLMEQVQRKIRELHRHDQVEQLRADTQRALSEGRVRDAATLVEQGLKLDVSDAVLTALRKQVTREEEAAAVPTTVQEAASTEVRAPEVIIRPEAATEAEAAESLAKTAVMGSDTELQAVDGVARWKKKIEEELAHADFESACTAADEALKAFPHEASLQELHTTAQHRLEDQRRGDEARRRADEVRALLRQGSTTDAFTMLEKVTKEFPNEPAISALLMEVCATAEPPPLVGEKEPEAVAVAAGAVASAEPEVLVEEAEPSTEPTIRDEAIAHVSERIHEFLEQHQTVEALAMLEDLVREFPNDPKVAALLAEVVATADAPPLAE